jgi:hypothetical protein
MQTGVPRKLIGVALCASFLGCSDDDVNAGDASAEDASAEDAAADASAENVEVLGELSMLSYNVAGLPQQFSRENPEENLPLISPKLEPYDIVLTQEDFDWWSRTLDNIDFVNYHERLRADVTHEYQTTEHPGPQAVGVDTDLRPLPLVGDGLGFLSRFPFENVVRVPWPRCFGGVDVRDGGAGDCLAMKGFMVGTFQLAEGVVVDIYNLHAEAGGTETDQELQAEDFEVLAEFIDEHSKGRAVILGGDTNLRTAGDHPDSYGDADGEIWTEFLEATSLLDSCDVLDCDEPGEIDKIAFREAGGVSLTPLSHELKTDEFKNAMGEDLSDHPPLEVQFRYGLRR